MTDGNIRETKGSEQKAFDEAMTQLGDKLIIVNEQSEKTTGRFTPWETSPGIQEA